MRKKELRVEQLKQLRQMNQQIYYERSKEIIDQLLGLEEFKSAKNIGITISRFPEVDTKSLIEKAWALGKNIAIPKCLPSTRQMDFRIFNSYNDLEVVYGDLLEPIVDKTMSIEKTHIDLLLVPGVVYNKKGYRIGFGGGYYDRYLVDFNQATFSFAFSEQVKESIPVQLHDIPVQKIITDKKIIDCRLERNEIN